MAVASVSKITAASSESFDAAVREGLARASKTLRGITGLHVIEHMASVESGNIEEYRVTMEVTFILENEASRFGNSRSHRLPQHWVRMRAQRARSSFSTGSNSSKLG